MCRPHSNVDWTYKKMNDFKAIKAKKKARKSKRRNNAKFMDAIKLVQAGYGQTVQECPTVPGSYGEGVDAPEWSRVSFVDKQGHKLSLKKLKKMLWDEMTTYVRLRDGDVCVACGYELGYALNHIVPASEGSWAKWSIDNVFWGCRTDNFKEFHHRAYWASVVFPRLFGQARISYLWEKSKEKVQYRRPDFEAMILNVRKLTEELNNGTAAN